MPMLDSVAAEWSSVAAWQRSERRVGGVGRLRDGAGLRYRGSDGLAVDLQRDFDVAAGGV